MEFYTIAIIALLGAMSPGPDFVIVAKNAIAYHRRAGIFTALGIAIGILFHSTYCILGLAVIISSSLIIFSTIKYLGAAYLIYLGLKSIFSKGKHTALNPAKSHKAISNKKAFKEGFLTNVLNPKCTLFMLSIFTMVVKPHTAYSTQIIYAAELIGIAFTWFTLLSYFLTQSKIKAGIDKIQAIVSKLLGAFLVAFGVKIALMHHKL